MTELLVRDTTCNFGTTHDSLIKYRINCGITDGVQREQLLREGDKDIPKFLQIRRATEISKQHIWEIESSKETSIHAIRQLV